MQNSGWLAGWLLAGWPLWRGMALECARACSNLRNARAPQKKLHVGIPCTLRKVILKGTTKEYYVGLFSSRALRKKIRRISYKSWKVR